MPELSVSADTIRQRFNYEWSVAEPIDGMDTYWWWARDIRVDPSEVIADDDEGNLWSVPFRTDGEDNVTFDQPVRVRQTYVPATTAASFTRPRKGAKPNAASARPTTEKEPTMDVDTTLLRRRLGLSEDATEEQITEALTAEESPETPPEGAAPTSTEPEQLPAAASAATPEVTADTVTVSRQVWEETNGRIERLEATERQRDEAAATRRRDDAASAAVGDGRITPAERAHYRSMLDIDERGTVELLGTLSAGRVPLHQRGEIPIEPQPGVASANDSGPDTSLLNPRQVAEMRDRGLLPETSR